MYLDEVDRFQAFDPQGVITAINSLPDQLLAAWELGKVLVIPQNFYSVRQVVVVGVGRFVTGAELAAAYASRSSPVPVIICRGDDLPAWVQGSETLVVGCSYSGATSETLTAVAQARLRGCCTLVLAPGGKLVELGQEIGAAVWQFQPPGAQGSAPGYAFGLLLALFYRMGWIADPFADLMETIVAMRGLQANFYPDIPAARNPAKRMAGQILGRWAVFFASEEMRAAARYWKEQVNVSAKAWAQFETLPDVGHTGLAGLNHPENAVSQMMALFFVAPSDSAHNKKRLDLARQIFMLQGANTDFLAAQGSNPMAHLWTLALYGDYVAYYLAVANEEDPSQAEVVEQYKLELSDLTE